MDRKKTTMTQHTDIIATEARIPLARLSLSPLNPRQDVPEADIIALAKSIWDAGLIQSLAGVIDQHGKAEIVAGGRRLRALQHLAKTKDGFPIEDGFIKPHRATEARDDTPKSPFPKTLVGLSIAE